MLKVAVATAFPRDTQSPRGGVEAVSVNLVKALAGHEDLDVHVVTADRDISTPEVYSASGATIHRLPRPAGSLLKFAVGAGRTAVQSYLAAVNPDLIHAHDTYGIMVKGMPSPRVFAADVQVDGLFGGVRLPCVATRASDGGFDVRGVDLVFHVLMLSGG